MTQLSNVPMHPNPNAVERPMTLIEKLERKQSEISAMMQDDAPFPCYYMAGQLNTVRECIDIVKQHSDWVGVDERLPDKFWNDDKKYYCRVDTMGCIEFKILVWRYGDWHNLDLSPLGQKGFTIMPRVTHYFELPQSPSEVQE